MEKHDRSREPSAVSEWLERYRHFRDARFQQLDDYLRQLQEQEHTHGRQD